MLERAAELGYLTPAEVESLDAWGGNMATEICNGEITWDEAQARIVARLAADLARRGQA